MFVTDPQEAPISCPQGYIDLAKSSTSSYLRIRSLLKHQIDVIEATAGRIVVFCTKADQKTIRDCAILLFVPLFNR
jgi:hypothetical protein